ncbi:MAG: dTDP-4-dehydrorhamnose 3,5-epimerase [bacterium]
MKVEAMDLPGVLLVTPQVFRDSRGFFLETYHAERYRGFGMDACFIQDNQSRSARGTLRGLHAQREHPQVKLVRCVRGSIWDVAVDLRLGSPTFGRWAGAELDEKNFRQIYVPVGFAHGFITLSESAEVEYKCSDLYAPSDQFSLRWDDPELGIPWPIKEPFLSEKDRQAPTLQELLAKGMLPRFEA